MQFRQPGWHFSASKLKLPPSISEKRCKRIKFQSKVFQQIDHLDTWDAISQPLLAHFTRKSKTVSLGFEKNCTNFFFQKNHFSPQWLCVIIEHFFENHAEKNPQNPKKFSLEVQEISKNLLFEKTLFAMKMIIWIRTMQLGQLCRKFFSYRTQCLSGKNGV